MNERWQTPKKNSNEHPLSTLDIIRALFPLAPAPPISGDSQGGNGTVSYNRTGHSHVVLCDPLNDNDESPIEAAIAVSAGGAVGSGIAALVASRLAQQQALAAADEMISVVASAETADFAGSIGLATIDTLAA